MLLLGSAHGKEIHVTSKSRKGVLCAGWGWKWAWILEQLTWKNYCAVCKGRQWLLHFNYFRDLHSKWKSEPAPTTYKLQFRIGPSFVHYWWMLHTVPKSSVAFMVRMMPAWKQNHMQWYISRSVENLSKGSLPFHRKFSYHLESHLYEDIACILKRD